MQHTTIYQLMKKKCISQYIVLLYQNLTKCQLIGHVRPWVPWYTCLPHPHKLSVEILS